MEIEELLASYTATQHLLDLGHKRIAYLTGPPAAPWAHERFEGYRRALREAGLEVDDKLVFQSGSTIEDGTNAALQMLNEGCNATAVQAVSDLVAIGCANALLSQGLKIPEDISIVGFGNILAAEYFHVPLTTIRQPKHRLGVAAVETMMALLRGEKVQPKRLSAELIQRKSSAPPKKVEDLEQWREKGQAAQMQVPIELLTPAEWNFVPGTSQPLFEKINAQRYKLEGVADIFVGLQTSADDVFILNYLGETKGSIRLQSQSLGLEWTFEKELLHPLVSGTDVPAYGPLPHRQYIIFPYKVKGDKAELIDFGEIQKKFPKTAEYLSKNRITLEEREGRKFKDEEWHRFGRLQNLTRQALPKLCDPRF